MLDVELREGIPSKGKFEEVLGTWDATLLSMTWKCPRSLYWFLRRVDYNGEAKPPYFVWGSAFQEILTKWYELPSEQRLDDTENAIEKALHAGLTLWDLEGMDSPPNDTRAGLIKIFEAYVDFYPSEPWSLVKDGGELGWVWPLVNTPYMLGGSLDGYINWPGYGKLILENKTSGQYLSDSYVSQWAFSTQITNYIWYLTQLHQKKSFGCLVNMITKNVPGPKAKWKTPRFVRSLETRSDIALNRFEEQVRYTIEKAKQFWENWYWPKTFDHVNCSGGPGISACKMKRLCLLDEPHYTELDPPAMFDYLKYRDTAWKPWERQGEQSND